MTAPITSITGNAHDRVQRCFIQLEKPTLGVKLVSEREIKTFVLKQMIQQLLLDGLSLL